MSRKINRDRVSWESASCRGLNTDLFYQMRVHLAAQNLEYNTLRRICHRCPIMKQCLEVGTAHERYGFWGGLAEEERNAIYERKNGRVVMRLKRDLELLDMPYEIFEDIVLNVEREFGDYVAPDGVIDGRRNKSR